MKNLLSISLIIMLSAGLIACKHDKDKNTQASVPDAAKAVVQAPATSVAPAPVVTPKEIAPATPAVTPKEIAPAAPATEEFKEGEVKQVCVNINGQKKCKKMKVHKKFEGTAIPPKK